MSLVFWLVVLTIGCVGGVFVFQIFRHKHTIVIRRVTGGKCLVKKHKFREFRDTDGVVWVKLMNKKELPHPPPSVIDVTDKGKMWCECWELESGDIRWVKDSKDKDEGFVPFNTNQRQDKNLKHNSPTSSYSTDTSFSSNSYYPHSL